MAKQNFDGVVEAVHYNADGQVDWVRTFLKRGPVFSDYIILDRQSLIDQIKAGKKFVAGRRIPQLASTFEVLAPVRTIQKDGKDILVSGEVDANQDRLNHVPIL